MREAFPSGITTALARYRSVAESTGNDSREAEQAQSDANKAFELPDDQWWCYDVGKAPEEHIHLIHHQDPRTYEIQVESGQLALARLITVRPFAPGEPAVQFHMLKPNPGRSKQRPVLTSRLGLSMLLYEQTLSEHLTIVDLSEASRLVNDDIDFTLNPANLLTAMARIVAAEPRD